MDHFKERSTRYYRQTPLFTKEELAEREFKCVHEEPAFCYAACPMKLDGRTFCAHIQKGDFTSARAMLERITPFPLILASGCSGPCGEKCRLAEIGESVDMPALERAALRFGAPKAGKGLFKIKKKKSCAVFGADLFSLILAAELDRKSYPTSFYVSESSPEEIFEKCAPFLEGDDLKIELKRLTSSDVKIYFGSALSKEFFEETKESFDVICASAKFRDALGLGSPDDTTLVCAGTSLISSSDSCSDVLGACFDARRAAVSADRLAQGLDPSNMRGEEGPVVSRLYTNLKNVLSSARVPEAEGYTAEKAVEEASRCIQCKCEECIDSCVYLQYHKKYPKILTREIYNNVDIIMGDHMMNKAINTCSLCGQCRIVCPNGYDVAEICLKARENMVSVDKMSLAYHEFALLDMLFSNGEAFLAKPQPGFERCRYVFFPGCQAGAIAPESVEKAYKDLCSRLPGGVGLVLGCCAAIAKWAGRTALHDEATAQLKKALESLGDPVIIAGCPTCMKMLSEDIGGEIKGIWEVLNETGLPEGSAKLGRKIILHDSCSARGDVPMQDEVRALAESLGCDLVETELSRDMTSCCGYGGLVSNVNKDLARKMAENTASDTSLPYLTYCMACRDNFAKIGRESMHILELVYDSPAHDCPGISEKRKNRLALKNRLLKEIWNEDVIEMTYDFKIDFTDEAKKQMEHRMILDTDIYALIDNFRKTGSGMIESATGKINSCVRIGNVTFWAWFTESGENEYTVTTCYSHRMTIETR